MRLGWRLNLSFERKHDRSSCSSHAHRVRQRRLCRLKQRGCSPGFPSTPIFYALPHDLFIISALNQTQKYFRALCNKKCDKRHADFFAGDDTAETLPSIRYPDTFSVWNGPEKIPMPGHVANDHDCPPRHLRINKSPLLLRTRASLHGLKQNRSKNDKSHRCTQQAPRQEDGEA